MNDRTDELLGALLTDAMEAHTADVEPERARQIARSASPQARRWPVAAAAAAAAVLLVAVPSYVANETRNDPDASASPVPTALGVTPGPLPSQDADYVARTTAENRSLAEAASRATLAKIPLPPGAVRLDGKPEGWPDSGMSLGPSDGRLTVTGWWSVPLSSEEMAAFLTDHTPSGMRHAEGEAAIDGGGSDGIASTYYVTEHATNPEAFLDPRLLVQFLQVGDHTVLRADTFIAAREAVSDENRISDVVTAVRIERVGRAKGATADQANSPLPTVLLSASADSEAIARLVGEFNGLDGSATAEPGSCPMPGNPAPETTVTFFTRSPTTGDTGTLVADLTPSCFGQVHVSVDGSALEGSLDPGGWASLVDGVADSAG